MSADEGIDCHFVKGGTTQFATNPAHIARLRAAVDEAHALGFTDDDDRWLDADAAAATRRRLRRARRRAHAHTAPRSIRPGSLVASPRWSSATACALYEQTRVQAIEGHAARTVHGTVTADVVVRATEAWTAELPGLRRAVAPVYSLMLATEPLPAERLGRDRLDRPRDDLRRPPHDHLRPAHRRRPDRVRRPRSARTTSDPRSDPSTTASSRCSSTCAASSPTSCPRPPTRAITHTWGGPLGIPRDWYPSCGYDRAPGSAWAGGYVGDGVSTTNLAGRTLSDLITGADTPIVHLPWVHHASPDWEPEPFRWLGHRALTGLARQLGPRRGPHRTPCPAHRAAQPPPRRLTPPPPTPPKRSSVDIASFVTRSLPRFVRRRSEPAASSRSPRQPHEGD